MDWKRLPVKVLDTETFEMVPLEVNLGRNMARVIEEDGTKRVLGDDERVLVGGAARTPEQVVALARVQPHLR